MARSALESVDLKEKITGGAKSQCDGREEDREGNQTMLLGTTALPRALPSKASPAQGTTSRAKMPVQHGVRITSGATLGMKRGIIVVPELRTNE